MGIWRFAGAFAVVERQSECGSKTAGMHVSQPVPIGVCYGLGFYSVLINVCFSPSVINTSVSLVTFSILEVEI